MSIKTILPILLSVLIVYSCAFHSGIMTSNASLGSDNFKVVGMASGTATTSKLFGIGGVYQNALVAEAKKDLYKNHPLSEGQTYANVSVDITNKFYLIYFETIATVTADIVDFSENPQVINKSSQPISIHEENFKYQPGDQVRIFVDNSFYQGLITSLTKDEAIVTYKSDSANKTTSLSKSSILIMNTPKLIGGREFSIEDQVIVKNKGKQITGLIMSFDDKGLYIKPKNSDVETQFYLTNKEFIDTLTN